MRSICAAGHDLADDVENRIVVQRVADFLELVQELFENATLNRVGRNEVEDQAVVALAVSVDATHPLFEPVRVPRNVIVDQEVAELQVDAFASSLGGDEHLDVAILELLLGKEPSSGDVAGADIHRAMDRPGLQSPGGQFRQDIIEGVLELGEDQQPLIRIGTEPFAFEEAVELDLADGFLDGLRQAGKALQLGDFLAHLLGVAGQGDGFKDALPPFPIRLLHFLKLVFRGDFGGCLAGDIPSLLQEFGEAVDPIFERPPQRVGRGR